MNGLIVSLSKIHKHKHAGSNVYKASTGRLDSLIVALLPGLPCRGRQSLCMWSHTRISCCMQHKQPWDSGGVCQSVCLGGCGLPLSPTHCLSFSSVPFCPQVSVCHFLIGHDHIKRYPSEKSTAETNAELGTEITITSFIISARMNQQSMKCSECNYKKD